jgi:hypothetical protein
MTRHPTRKLDLNDLISGKGRKNLAHGWNAKRGADGRWRVFRIDRDRYGNTTLLTEKLERFDTLWAARQAVSESP